MRFHIKQTGPSKLEAWVEDWDMKANEWDVVCKSKCFLMGHKCLVDTLDTPLKFRRKGYATALVKNLQHNFSEVAPIGVTESGKSFWEKFNMVDALGPEDRQGLLNEPLS